MFHITVQHIKQKSTRWLICLESSLTIFGLLAMTIKAPTASPNYLHTSGNRLLDASNAEVGLSGLNWFGFETDVHVPHGLFTRNWQEMLDQVKALDYNVIRLPFSNDMLDPGRMPSGIDYRRIQTSSI